MPDETVCPTVPSRLDPDPVEALGYYAVACRVCGDSHMFETTGVARVSRELTAFTDLHLHQGTRRIAWELRMGPGCTGS
jgi:hypothetical protein